MAKLERKGLKSPHSRIQFATLTVAAGGWILG